MDKIKDQNIEKLFSQLMTPLRSQLPIMEDEALEVLLGVLLLYKVSEFSERSKIVLDNNHVLTLPSQFQWENLNPWGPDFDNLILNALRYIGTTLLDIDDANFKPIRVLNTVQMNTGGDKALREVIFRLNEFNFKHNIDGSTVFQRLCNIAIEKYFEGIKKNYSLVPPPSICHLMVGLMQPREGMCIADPFIFNGCYFIESVKFQNNRTLGSKPLAFYGQNANIDAVTITKMNLLFNDIEHYNISTQDALVKPLLSENGDLKQFDLVMTNIPASTLPFHDDLVERDVFNRFIYGIPSKRSMEFIFIQHVLAILNENGKAGIIGPQGILFRESEKGIRRRLIENDLIEAIITLPAGIFLSTKISMVLLIFNKKKPADRKGKIQFIKGEFSDAKQKKQHLSDEDITQIIDAYNAGVNADDTISQMFTIEQVRERKFDLSMSLYTDECPEVENIDLEATLTELEKLDEKRRYLLSSLKEQFGKLREYKEGGN